MDNEEKLVQNYLTNNFSKVIAYEPDGNKSPDFILGEEIAIEVRRLNQNFFHDNKAEGLEELNFPLFDAFRETLGSFGKQESDTSYLVGIIYKRPLDNIHEIKEQIKQKLQSFLQGPSLSFPSQIIVSPKVRLFIQEVKSIDKNIFRSLGGSDENSGGRIISMYIENIQYCISEKSEKVNDYIQKYKEWWLILVDTMMWDLEKYELDEIAKYITDLGNFDKIIVIRNGQELISLCES
jgi:hypothetical protein